MGLEVKVKFGVLDNYLMCLKLPLIIALFSLSSNNLGSNCKKESNIQGTFHPIYKS